MDSQATYRKGTNGLRESEKNVFVVTITHRVIRSHDPFPVPSLTETSRLEAGERVPGRGRGAGASGPPPRFLPYHGNMNRPPPKASAVDDAERRNTRRSRVCVGGGGSRCTCDRLASVFFQKSTAPRQKGALLLAVHRWRWRLAIGSELP